MGYLGNHLATVIVAIFASALTVLYFVMPAPLHQLLLVSSTVTWFLTFICWIAQKSADYVHNHSEKKSSISIESHKPHTAQVKTATAPSACTAGSNVETSYLQHDNYDETACCCSDHDGTATIIALSAPTPEPASVSTWNRHETLKCWTSSRCH